MHAANIDAPLSRGRQTLAALRLSQLSLATLAGLGSDALLAATATNEAHDEPAYVDFNTSFTGDAVDISRFLHGNVVAPGVYRADIYVNGTRHSRRDILFREVGGKRSAQPCFDASLLESVGVDMDKIGSRAPAPGTACVDLGELIDAAIARFDAHTLRLDLSLPQASMRHDVRGYVSPSLWDRGVTAGRVSYGINAYRSTTLPRSAIDSRHTQDNVFIGLDNGLNIGDWRIRQRGTGQWRQGQGVRWQGIGAHAQRDITALRAQLTLGDSFTSGRLFDGNAYRGVNLASDERMRPDSQSGYAPVVRGVANSQARVTIRQNDFVIHETTVAPGAFEITDLYATGFGGDLHVTVTEADGHFRTFTVPFAAVPNLLRPGNQRYELTLGKMRGPSLAHAPTLLEGTYERGLNNWLTAYGGAQVTNRRTYRSVLLGAAVNTPMGAFSFDLTGARARLPGEASERGGYSMRVSYTKTLPATHTNINLATFRYTSDRFVSVQDAAMLLVPRERPENVSDRWASGRPTTRTQLSIAQPVRATGGSLFVSASNFHFRDRRRNQTTFNAGYSGNAGRLGYSISASRTLLPDGRRDQQYFANFSLPLGRTDARKSTLLNSSLTRDSNGSHGARVGVTGSLGDGYDVTYGASASSQPHNNSQTTFSGNASWNAPFATLGGGYSHQRHSRQMSFNASGALVAHAGGITLAPRLGDTIAIVEAKGATGARLDGHALVNRRGYAVLSGLTPYRMRDVNVDLKGTATDVELESTRMQVAPRAGAVVAIRFVAREGEALLIRTTDTQGEPLPFGAQVVDQEGHEVGVVGQGGHAYVRAGKDTSELSVIWGDGANARCTLDLAAISPAVGAPQANRDRANQRTSVCATMSDP